jgi:hypothetical protein
MPWHPGKLTMAIGIYPGFRRPTRLLGNRPALASAVITALTLTALIIPTIRLTGMSESLRRRP